MKGWLIFLTIGLVLANIFAIFFLDEEIDRWFRFGATFIFLLIYIFKYFPQFELLIIFLLITICDACLVFYEEAVFRNLVYLCRIFAYIAIISLLAKNLSRLEFSYFSVFIGAFVVSIDIYLIHEMAEVLPKNQRTPLFLSLFYGLGIFSLILVATCLSYFFRFANKRAFYIIVTSFSFVLSDIFYYNAYYLNFGSFYYFDRLTNIIGMTALVLFSREMLRQASGIKEVEHPKYL